LAKNYKYKAFISYSHSDEKWASWLHKALEAYRPPKGLVGHETPYGPVPERFAPVFRDREELATATSLGDTLTQALEDSACQIVICSPRAAKSHWTNEEILTYKRLGRSHRIFALIVDGEPGASQSPDTADDECFPPALIYEMGDDGELTDVRSEPIAADARPGKDPKQAAKLKLLAGMLGVGFDDLAQREVQRRHRRMMAITTAAMIGMAITSGLAVTAYLARLEAEEQRRIAEIEAETSRQTTDFMVGLFEVSDPSESLGNTITAREILDKGAERIDEELIDQPEIQATLMDTMGTVYKSLGLYEPATLLVTRALDRRVDLFGNIHPEVGESLNNLGEVQALTADYESAEENLRNAIEVRQEIHGRESLEVAATLLDLAAVLTEQGRFDEAEAPIRESLQIHTALLDSSNEEVAAGLEALGLNLYDRGDLDQAVVELRSAAAMRRELHGDIHPDLATAMGNLAFVLSELGELVEAEELFREVLAMTKELYGGVHPDVAASLNNVGLVAANKGELDRAEAAYREALEIERELLSDKHPNVIEGQVNIALLRYQAGDVDNAIEMMRETLSLRREVLEPGHPDIAGSALNLSQWLIETNRFEEAAPLIDEAIEIRANAFGEEHPRASVARLVKANYLLATNQGDAALELSEGTRASLLGILPEEHWLVAYASSAYGAALAMSDNFMEAESVLLASLEPLQSAPIPGAVELHKNRLASLYRDWGKPEQAEAYLLD
jgi:tetratricopeptide (TPR) repeat protein